jgi:hypothetical protein
MSVRMAINIDLYPLEITTPNGKKVLIEPTCAFIQKPRDSAMKAFEDWYGRLIDVIPILGEDCMQLFIDCQFHPAPFFMILKLKGYKLRFVK